MGVRQRARSNRAIRNLPSNLRRAARSAVARSSGT